MPLADSTATWRKAPKGGGIIHRYHYAWSYRINFAAKKGPTKLIINFITTIPFT
ncbi:hypothetical protein HanRHA438_Chr05g0216241 [Helianthus annuus]|nr:hypothetical protein HanRHA438_Chr05g0216241 [Helianthus annuus]